MCFILKKNTFFLNFISSGRIGKNLTKSDYFWFNSSGRVANVNFGATMHGH